MTKVVIGVAQHVVEVEADASLDEVAAVAAGLWIDSKPPPMANLRYGFESMTPPLMDRALPFAEPQADPDERNR